jgi:hypothetical protein
MRTVLQEIEHERRRQEASPVNCLDQGHTRNDWVALIAAYNGCASAKVVRNQGEDFRKCMVTVAALAVAAIEAHDKGWC